MKYLKKINNKTFNVLCVCWFVMPIVLEQLGLIGLQIAYTLLLSFVIFFPMLIQEYHNK